MIILMNGDPAHKVDMHHYAGFFSDEVFYQQIPSEVKLMGEVFQVTGDLTYAYSNDGKQMHVAAVPYIQCDRELNVSSPVSDMTGRILTYISTSHNGRYPLVTYFYSSVKITTSNYIIKHKKLPMVYGPLEFNKKKDLIEFIGSPKPAQFCNRLTCWIKPNLRMQVSLTDDEGEVFNLHL